jgi:PAS domain S-box-containing protein
MEVSSILIVEDEFVIAKDIETSLENMGYSVCAIVSSGREAIAKAEKEKPDLVLMDMVLKGSIDGVEAARKIGTQFKIPIVYLTAYADENTLERAKKTEPYGYIIKPFNDRELNTTIKMALYNCKMEAKLREGEDRYRFLAENMADIVWIIDLDLQTTYVSPSIEKVLGFTPEERKKQTLEEMLTPDALKKITETFSQELELEKERKDQDRSLSIELEYYHKNGSIVWLESNVKAMRDSAGNLIGIYGSSRDISARKRAETALLKSEKKYRDLFENVLDYIYSHDLEGNFIETNLTAVVAYGFGDSELRGKNVRDIIDDKSKHLFDEYLQKVLKYGKSEGLVKVVTRSGIKRILEYRNSLILGPEGPVGVRGCARDISERIIYEKALKKEKEKLQQALDQVKTLSGLLPICSYCKKIRDDQGYWNQIEEYIHHHTDIEFSHSICQECAKKYYPEMDLYGECHGDGKSPSDQ